MAVPIIDLGTAENSSKQLVALDEACRDHGFFLLMNHGMDKVNGCYPMDVNQGVATNGSSMGYFFRKHHH